jgi:hypothetical protein
MARGLRNREDRIKALAIPMLFDIVGRPSCRASSIRCGKNIAPRLQEKELKRKRTITK